MKLATALLLALMLSCQKTPSPNSVSVPYCPSGSDYCTTGVVVAFKAGHLYAYFDEVEGWKDVSGKPLSK